MLFVLLAWMSLAPVQTTHHQSGLEFDWSADEACPQTPELRAQLDALLSTSRRPEHTRVSGLLRAQRWGGFELTLELRLGDARKRVRVDGPDCDELGALAAQFIANAMDPTVFAPTLEDSAIVVRPSAHRSPPAPLPTPLPAPLPVETPDLEEPPGDAPSEFGPLSLDLGLDLDLDLGLGLGAEALDTPELLPRPRPHGLVLLEAGGLLGALPNFSGGLHLGLALEQGRGRIEIAGGWWPAAGAFLSPSDPSVGGEVQAWAVDVAGCGLPRAGPVDFPLCARLGAGQQIATGFGVDDARTLAQAWVWASGEAGTEWWLDPRFALTATLGAGAVLGRPSFEISGSDARFDTPRAFARLGLGVAGRFVGSRRPPPRRSKPDRRVADRKAGRSL